MKPMNVLIVDDSAVMRKMVLRAIRLTEVPIAEVHEAGNGLEALNVLDTHEIHALFTDIHMPGMNGVDLLIELATRTGPQPARIVISTDGSDPRRREMEALSVHCFLEKPLRPEVMRDVLYELANRLPR